MAYAFTGAALPVSVLPTFRDLDRAEMEAILARHNVGRLAFTFRDRVDIEPIHYVYADGVINCRTAPGTKMEVLAHHPWVAFEVDEGEGVFSWRSVVAKGTAYVGEADGSEHDRQSYARAVEALRRLLPETLTAQDPVAFRSVILRIHVTELTGRAAEATPPG